MKVWLTRSMLGLVITIWASSDSAAQVSRAGIGERDRGLFNRLGARREDRLERKAPTPAPNNNPAPTSAAARGNAAPNSNNAAPAISGGNSNRSAINPPGLAGPNSNFAGRAGASSVAAGYPNLNQSPAPIGDRLPPNRLPYTGPGVVIRLPERLPGEVNYLLDDVEHLIVYSGQTHHLSRAPRYEVRFSRGVTADGQSYGEARYAVSEGVYRFDVSANGWELYREGEATDVRLAVQQAQARETQARETQSLPNVTNFQTAQASGQAGPTSGLAPVDTSVERGSSVGVPSPTTTPSTTDAKSADELLPSPAPVAGVSEDDLPVPKSILEPT